MSHLVSIKTKVRDVVAIAAACHRLGLAAPEQGTAKLYSGTVTGVLLRLSGWQYPAVVDNYLTEYTDTKGMINMRGPETGQYGLTLSLIARSRSLTMVVGRPSSRAHME